MTDHQERILLARHGTVDVALPPSAILYAAKEDFARRGRNKLIAKGTGAWLPFSRYAFLASHVRNAKSPAEILRRAMAWKQHQPKPDTLADQGPVPKLSMLRLTASVENLAAAIQMAEEAND